MTNKKYIMVELGDEKIASLAEALGNKTCKKILEYLTDKEACETEIARDLKLPANTVNYNIKKLLKAGLIEKSKFFLWSIKGKKIIKYKVANKKILISPKTSSASKSLLSAFLATGIGAFLIKLYYGSSSFVGTNVNKAVDFVEESPAVLSDSAVGVSQEVARAGVDNAINNVSCLPELWIWFFLGGLFALIVYMLINYRRL